MSVKYKIVAKSNPQDPSLPESYFVSAVRTETLDLESMVDLISDYSTVNPPDVMAVLESMIRLIPQQLLKGRGISLGNLGSFYLTLSSSGSASIKDVSEKNVRGINIRFQPAKKFKNRFKDASFEKLG